MLQIPVLLQQAEPTLPTLTKSACSPLQFNPLAGICIPLSHATRKGLTRQGHIWQMRARVQKEGLDVWLEKWLVQNQNSSCKYSLAWQLLHLREVRKHLPRSEQQCLAWPCQDQVLDPPFPYFIQGLHLSCLILDLLFPSFFASFFLAYAFFPQFPVAPLRVTLW